MDGVEGGMPAEGRALDAGGEGMDAGERAQVADFLGFASARDDVTKILIQSLRLGGGFAFELSRHERRARLRNGTTRTIEGDLGNLIAFKPQVHASLFAARRIIAMGNPVGSGQLASIARTFIVIEDNLLIELGEIGGHGSEEPMSNSRGRMATRETSRVAEVVC